VKLNGEVKLQTKRWFIFLVVLLTILWHVQRLRSKEIRPNSILVGYINMSMFFFRFCLMTANKRWAYDRPWRWEFTLSKRKHIYYIYYPSHSERSIYWL